MSKQLLRSGTAIGALVREAEPAESKADFIHKNAIAQKFESIYSDATVVVKILTSGIKTAKRSINP